MRRAWHSEWILRCPTGMKREVYFSLGSNLGDRESNLREALRMMDESFGHGYERVSGVVETASWGFEGRQFLNLAVMYRLELDPVDILDRVKDIEFRMGRKGAPEWDEEGHRIYRDRIIDIDILLYGDEKIDTLRLKIPHPLMQQREFVMRPLKEILI